MSKFTEYLEATKKDPDKKTPKTIAQDLIMQALGNVRGYWKENDSDDLTPKEISEVDRQLKILCDRIAKSYKFNESWVN
jgi:hypothetical protein